METRPSTARLEKKRSTSGAPISDACRLPRRRKKRRIQPTWAFSVFGLRWRSRSASRMRSSSFGPAARQRRGGYFECDSLRTRRRRRAKCQLPLVRRSRSATAQKGCRFAGQASAANSYRLMNGASTCPVDERLVRAVKGAFRGSGGRVVCIRDRSKVMYLSSPCSRYPPRSRRGR